MFAHIFIDRPVFAMVISIVIIIIGTVSLLTLPIERYPDIAPPTVNVVATFPGADAQTVSDTVASPLEASINGVEHMLYFSSVCGNDGTMRMTITFKSGTNLDMATVLTQNRVSATLSQLPEEVQRLGVIVEKASPETNIYMALYSDDDRFDDIFLSNYLNLRIKDEIARVSGVGNVSTFGIGDYSMRLWLDPDKMHSRKLTPGDVIAAVRSQNKQVAGGQVGQPPAPEGQAFQLTVNVKGRLTTTDEFENIVVRTGKEGRVVRLRDVARVELGAIQYDTAAKFNGLLAAALTVNQIPGANAIEVVNGVKAKMEELSEGFPEGLKYSIAYDNTVVIKSSIEEVIITLFITLVLVILTVYIFLQNFRAVVIPAVTIPVSLIGTFAALALVGFSINQFTLFGLVLVIGIVVDDAIVVVENATRYLQQGNCSPKEAAKRAMTEISGPVIATTLVLLAVFIPTSFMPGITGTLFQQFAITIAVATCFSTLNALTLSPALCGILLRRTDEDKIGSFFKLFNRSLAKTTTGFSAVTSLIMRHSVIGILIFLVITAGSIFGFISLPTGFVPQEDEGYCLVNIQLPDGASQERIIDFMAKAEAVARDTPGIKNYLSITGYSILDGVVTPNAGFMVTVFEDWGDRGADEHQNMILAHLNRELSRLRQGVCFAFPPPSLPGLGLTGGFTFMIQDRGDMGMSVLDQIAQEFVEDGNSQTGLTGMNNTFRANVPQIFFDIDRDQALTRGISMDSVFETLQYNLAGVYINDFTLYNRSFQVKAQADSQFRAEIQDIRRLELRAPNGEMVPLGTVATAEEIYGPQSITRYNMYPSVKLMGEAAPGFSSGQAMDIIEGMAAAKLPGTLGTEWTELSYQERTAAGSTSILFILAIVLVYLVLAAQYESWSVPIAVCMAVPTALLGAVAAIMLRQMDNNVYTQVGIVLLIGLSTKSAILIVEFAKQKYESGMSAFDATLEALKLRFRAVLMTAFSFILGVIPLLVASGAGAESRKVLGTVVFGGMLVATVISLIIVPLIYYVVQTLAAGSKKPVNNAPTKPIVKRRRSKLK